MKTKGMKRNILALALVFIIALISFGVPVAQAAPEATPPHIVGVSDSWETISLDSIPEGSITSGPAFEQISREEAMELMVTNTRTFGVDRAVSFAPFDSMSQGSITITEAPTADQISQAYQELNERTSADERATWSFNGSVAGGGVTIDQNRFTLPAGTIIYFDLRWSPSTANGTNFGVYNHNTGQYTLNFVSSNPTSSIFVIPADGLFSFAIGNDSSQAITFSGSYTL